MHAVTEAWKGYGNSAEKEMEPGGSDLGYRPSLEARHRKETARLQ